MLKRTAKHQYTEKMARADAMAGRLAGVTSDQEKLFANHLAREDREYNHEKKRLANAKRSGRGDRECLRRYTRMPGTPVTPKMLKFFTPNYP